MLLSHHYLLLVAGVVLARMDQVMFSVQWVSPRALAAARQVLIIYSFIVCFRYINLDA